MASNNGHNRDGSLEDQLRSMILSNGTTELQHQLPTLPITAQPAIPIHGHPENHNVGPPGPRRGGNHRGGPHHGPNHGSGFEGRHHRGDHHDFGFDRGHHRGGHHSHSRPPRGPHHQPPHNADSAHAHGSEFLPTFRGREFPNLPHRSGPPFHVARHSMPGCHNRPDFHIQDVPNTFETGRHSQWSHQPRQPRELYQPHSHAPHMQAGPQYDAQWQFLEQLVSREVPPIEMTPDEISAKDSFRLHLESICQNLKKQHPDLVLPTVALHSFGSLSSGFATKGSDMDLAIVTESDFSKEEQFSLHENNLPRVLEKELLDHGLGARLLTRTRVPIIKICEKPPEELLNALREERQRWESLPDEEKYALHDNPASKKDVEIPVTETKTSENVSTAVSDLSKHPDATSIPVMIAGAENERRAIPLETSTSDSAPVKVIKIKEAHEVAATESTTTQQAQIAQARQRRDKAWTRERAPGPLDFPKENVGIQCDINFFNPLGIYNTRLLRCYAKCDPRVIPMVLFVKAWAKKRKVNSSYSGSLSSYGYVLMVLHYLVNVARPPVLPNLQLQAAQTGIPGVTIDGCEVRFFSDEKEIENSASSELLTQNRQPLGVLLRGFFQYFASTAGGQGFIWMQDVLSLRTPGGLMKKEEKGWTSAKTEVGDNQKEVRQRYLFAIEDPFELTHNVARTVTHNGIVAIRDEFRRSWRIIQAVGRGLVPHDGDFFAELQEHIQPSHTDVAPSKHVPFSPETAAPLESKPVPAQQYADAFPQLGAPNIQAKQQPGVSALPAAQKPQGRPRFQRPSQRGSRGANQKHTASNQAVAHV